MNSRNRIHGGGIRRTALTTEFLAGVLLTGLGFSGAFLVPTGAWADQVTTVQSYNTGEGQITAVGLTFLEVENRSYRLDPKLEIRTEEGQPVELKQLQPGMGVQFRLKDGAMSKITVVTPR
jgi:hypothetical protein